MKRRVLSLVLLAVLLLPMALTLTSCGEKTTKLYIYNWGEYMPLGADDSENVLELFETYYEETYGDVTATFLFPTPFTADKAIVAFVGIPDEQDDTCFRWMPLHAEKVINGIDITFSSSVLPTMMTDAALLLVMSEPIEE